MISLAGLCGSVVDGAYNYLVYIVKIHTNTDTLTTLLYHVPYSLFLLAWIIALICLLSHGVNARRAEPRMAALGIGVVVVGYALLFLMFYYPVLATFTGSKLAKTFHIIFAAFESGAFILGLVTLLLNRERAAMFLVTGILVLLSNDVVFQMEEIAAIQRPADLLEVSWTFALALILFGLLEGLTSRTAHPEGSLNRSIMSAASIRVRSSVGAVAVAAGMAVTLLFTFEIYTSSNRVLGMEVARYTLYFANLIVIGFVVAVALFELRLEGVLRDYQGSVTKLSTEMEADSGGKSHILEILGLRAALSQMGARWRFYREQSIPLDSEPVFRGRSVLPGEARQSLCFVLMPFTTEWSLATYDAINSVVGPVGYRCLRANEIFGANVMQDIWTGIQSARAIIADLTGRNANVLYEVGIAHTLGKPTILLAQSETDIPFDLASRRVIIYDGKDPELKSLKHNLRVMLEDMQKSRLRRHSARV
jgi:hypothetical protein